MARPDKVRDAPRAARRRIAAGVAAAAVLLALVACVWLLPQYLDWTRYRGTIEDIASRELGRSVRIEGGIALSLLPDPVLTADRVVVAAAEEDGPGVSLKVNALRLQVALAPLLVGRVAPRALVLHEPELRVPWPLPEPLHLHPAGWSGPFAAEVEHGRLIVGRVALEGIDGTFATGSDGTLTATGTGEAHGLPWHVAARLGSMEESGLQTLALALDGQGRATGLGAAFDGTLAADATVRGRLTARGPDLSLLLPAAAVPFQAEGPIRVSDGRATLDDLALTVGGSPMRARVALRVRPAERLDVTLDAGRLDLDAWLPGLRRAETWLGRWTVPAGIDLSAEAAALGGGMLRRLRLTLEVSERAATVRRAEALLPGEAAFYGAGRLELTNGAPAFDGSIRLDASDLRTTLPWIVALGGDRLDAAALPRAAALAAHAAAGGGAVALTDIAGALDGSTVAGAIAWRPGGQPRVDADLRFDHLALDPLLAGWMADLRVLPHVFPGRLRLAVAKASLRGVGIDGFRLDAVDGEGALTVRGLAGTARGVRFAASGTVGEGGWLGDARLELTAADAGSIAGVLPAGWRATPALWRGSAALQATAEGPPDALVARVGVDLGDARLEAQPTIDVPRRRWSGPATLRHPGARRLLEALGLANAGEWIGDGSLSVAGQFSGGPGVLTAERADLTAGLLRASGRVAVDVAARGGPRLTGQVAAESLPVRLPAPDDREPLVLDGLRGWSAAVQVTAAALFPAAAPDFALRQAEGTVTLDGGHLRLTGFRARLGSVGAVQGSAEFDASGDIPRISLDGRLDGLDLPAPVTGWPVDVVAGRGEAAFQLHGEGHSAAALLATTSGSANLALHGGVLSGVDLPAVRASFDQHGADRAAAAETAIRTALASAGTTPFDALTGMAGIANGVATLQDTKLDGRAGTIRFTGSISLQPPALDLQASLQPRIDAGGRPGAAPPTIGLRLAGPVAAVRRTPELATLAQWLAEQAP